MSLMAATSSLRLERVWQIGGDEVLREYGFERDSVEGEERKRELEIEFRDALNLITDEVKRKRKRIKVKEKELKG